MRHAGVEQVERARAERGAVLYVFTHGVILPLAYTHRNRGVYVLISESRDGEIITRITGRMGLKAVRGSSTRGGGRAVVELARLARAGHDLAITPDGPKGPRGSVGPGAAFVAARAGIAIIPIGVAADRAWRASSWDRFLVPLVGARVAVAYGPALVFTSEEAAGDGSASTIGRAMQEAEERAETLLRTDFRGVETRRRAP
jgi:lysophospholipid acyltransferase (LPLAT)-like uncharacterized protein